MVTPSSLKISGGYICIVAWRSELEQHNDSIIILYGGGQQVDSDGCQTKYCPSGMVVLALIKLQQ